MPGNALHRFAQPALWSSWFSVLLGTPFFLADPLSGISYSNRYLFVAIGLLIGSYLSCRPQPPRFSLRNLKRFSVAIGVAATIIAVIPEWLYLSHYHWTDANEIKYHVTYLVFRLFIDAQPFLLVLGSTLYIFTGGRLIGKSIHAMPPSTKRSNGGKMQRYVAPSILLIAPISMFLIGFFHKSWPGLIDRLMSGIMLDQALQSLLIYAIAATSFMFFSATAWILHAFVCRVARTHESDHTIYSALYARLILSLALGMICWNLITRVLPVLGQAPHWSDAGEWIRIIPAGGPELGVLITLAMLAWLAVGVKNGPKAGKFGSAMPSGQTDQDTPSNAASINSDNDSDIDKLCAASGLTEREATAVKLLIEGKTSAQSADLMEIKPQTVRTYLQRAYKKIKVDNGEELAKAWNGKTENAVFTASVEKVHNVQCHAQASKYNLALGMALIVAACLFLLPQSIERLTWSSGREMLVGSSIALLLVAVLAHHTSWAISRNVIKLKGNQTFRRRPAVWLIGVVAGVVALVAIMTLGACSIIVSSSAGDGIETPSLAYCASSFAFMLILCVGGWSILRFLHYSSEQLCLLYGGSCACVVASVVAWSYLEESRWALTVILSLVVCVLSAISFFEKRDTSDTKHAPRLASLTQPRFLTVFFGCTCLAYGFVWEESWRGSDLFMTPFFIGLYAACGIICFSVYLWHTKGTRKSIYLIAVSLGICIGAFAMGVYSLVLAVSFLLFSLISLDAIHERLLSFNTALGGMALLACGCMIGLIGMDMINDLVYLKVYNALVLFEGVKNLKTLIAFGYGLLLMFFLLSVGLFYKNLFDQKLALSLLDKENQGDFMDELRRLLLKDGLNETQASVALLILEGLTTKQIAERLNYSPGTVNTARMAIYRTLGIHSRMELTAVLLKKMA